MRYFLGRAIVISLFLTSPSVFADETLVTCRSGNVLVRVNKVAEYLFLNESEMKERIEAVRFGPVRVTLHDLALEREVFKSDSFKLVTQVVGDEMSGEEERLEATYSNKVTGTRLRHMICE